MTRPTRAFKLRLSNDGIDLLIDCHCHLIRSTRQLLAWGTTLHIAVNYLETLPIAEVVKLLTCLPMLGLRGQSEHYLGAPCGLKDIADRIVASVAIAAPACRPPALAHIYLVSLQAAACADEAAVRNIYQRVTGN